MTDKNYSWYKEENLCIENKGKVIETWETGDSECNAESKRYECGAVYHHNYMDVPGSRDHDCFWDCSKCKRRDLTD